MDYLALAFGLVLMILGANYFVEYAVGLAKHLRLHVAVFGAVIVAIGTSLPELVVTIESALAKSPEIIVGNVLGSNIANIGLVMGITLLLGKVSSTHAELNGKNRLLLVLSVVFIGLIWLKLLFWPIGLVLLSIAAFHVFNLTKGRGERLDVPMLSTKKHIISWLVLVASLVGVVIGSQAVINSSLSIATAWGIPVGVIAATVIAIGTSLPELVVTMTALRKKERELAIGNVIGSNLFNLALIGGVGATIAHLNVALTVPITIFFLVFTIAAFILASGHIKPKRWHGVIMILIFVIYIATEYANA
jgi:cation:H+ antiporter